MVECTEHTYSSHETHMFLIERIYFTETCMYVYIYIYMAELVNYRLKVLVYTYTSTPWNPEFPCRRPQNDKIPRKNDNHPGKQKCRNRSSHRKTISIGWISCHLSHFSTLVFEIGDMARYGEIWWDKARYGETWRDMARYGEIWQDMARYGEMWRVTARHGEIWRDVARYSEISEILRDMVRYGQIYGEI